MSATGAAGVGIILGSSNPVLSANSKSTSALSAYIVSLYSKHCIFAYKLPSTSLISCTCDTLNNLPSGKP